jgi:hypothetical protein
LDFRKFEETRANRRKSERGRAQISLNLRHEGARARGGCPKMKKRIKKKIENLSVVAALRTIKRRM